MKNTKIAGCYLIFISSFIISIRNRICKGQKWRRRFSWVIHGLNAKIWDSIELLKSLAKSCPPAGFYHNPTLLVCLKI